MRSRAFLLSSALLMSIALDAGARDLRQLSPEEESRAKQAYMDGNAAYKLGHWEEAAKAFEQAYRVSRFENILFDMGQTYRRWYEDGHDLDKLKKSIEMYQSFLRDAKPEARQRPIAEKLVKELSDRYKSETRRQREEMLARASGTDALFLVDKLISDNDLKDAAAVLDRVLAARGSSREVLAGAYERRGMVAGALAARGNGAERPIAVDAFKRALALDPGYQLPEDAEKPTREAFASAQAAMQGKRPLAISHVPPGDVPKGRAVKIPVAVESDPLDQITSFDLHYRLSGSGAFSVARASRSAGSVEVPAPFLAGMHGGTKVDFYIVALDEKDDQLQSLGTARDPFVFAVALDPTELAVAAESPAARETPAYKKWWVWTLVAGALAAGAGAGLGIYYGTRGSVNNPPSVPLPTP
jgi:tetratricopeptide (TPR) repeat protein